MLEKIKTSLQQLITGQRTNLTDTERITYFCSNFKGVEFARKDYLEVFREISIATATRDMKKGIELKFWNKVGDNRTTTYRIVSGDNK